MKKTDVTCKKCAKEYTVYSGRDDSNVGDICVKCAVHEDRVLDLLKGSLLNTDLHPCDEMRLLEKIEDLVDDSERRGMERAAGIADKTDTWRYGDTQESTVAREIRKAAKG